MLLDGKNIIVTGGASGIGLSIVERMCEEGANVVIADMDAQRGKALEARLNSEGKISWFVEFDASKLDSIDAMAEKAIELTGGVDGLVNNAGVTRTIPILNITPKDWDWIQEINTRGLFFCLQKVATHMKDRGGGRIVNIASIAGKGVKGTSNASYAASKAAAIVIGRVAASELGIYNIAVNSICPGPTRTELLSKLDKSVIAGLEKNAALMRISDTTEIANTAVFLCSDLAIGITGQSINVDNGLVWD